MSRVTAVLVALFLAVHVSVAGIPAPLPILLAFAYVIAAQLHLIYRASGFRLRIVWKTVPW